MLSNLPPPPPQTGPTQTMPSCHALNFIWGEHWVLCFILTKLAQKIRQLDISANGMFHVSLITTNGSAQKYVRQTFSQFFWPKASTCT